MAQIVVLMNPVWEKIAGRPHLLDTVCETAFNDNKDSLQTSCGVSSSCGDLAILMAEFSCPFANIPPKQSTTNKMCFSSAAEQSQDSLLRCLSECFELHNKSHLMNYEQSLFVMFVMCFLDDLL